MHDEEPKYLRQCRRFIKDPDVLALTLDYYEFAKQIAPYRDWGTENAEHLSAKVYMPLRDDSGSAVFAIRTDGVVQIWPGEIVKLAPPAISQWFTAQLADWPELTSKGTKAPLFHLEREFNTQETFERFTQLFAQLKEKLSK